MDGEEHEQLLKMMTNAWRYFFSRTMELEIEVQLLRYGKLVSGKNLKDIEKSYILKVLKDNDYSQKKAAYELGISQKVMNDKIRKFGLSHPNWRKNNGDVL